MDTTRPPIAEREQERLAALNRYGLLDTAPEDCFDDLTRLAAQVCGTPVALLSLVDRRRAWFKSRVNAPRPDIPRESAFCRHVLTSGAMLLIPDARQDARFADNPFVTGHPHIRFYAGVPLATPDGHVLGALCVLDTRPRRLSAGQISALEALARQSMAQMELRRQVAEVARAEAQRRHSEEQYRALFDAHPNPMWVFERDTLCILEVNAAAVTHYGYSREDFLRLTIAHLRAPEDLHALRDGIHPAPSCTRRAGVFRHQRKDGTPVWADVTSHPLHLTGRDCRMVIARDVTAQHQAEEALRGAEEKYRSIFENAVEGIFQTVPGGGFAGANPALARMLGYGSPAELLAAIRDVGAQVYADPAERAELLRRFNTEGMVSDFELQVRRKDGTTLWASLSARAVRDTDAGRLLYIEGSAVDVTERRRTEERLRHMAAVVESSHEAIISKTLGDVVLSWNAGAERLYGYSAQEAVGRRFADLAPPAENTAAGGTLLARLLAGERVSQVETARLDRHGRRVEVSVSLWPVRDAQGRIQAVSSIAHDITERKRAEEALRERERQLQTLADNVPSLIARLDADLRYRFCNQAYQEYTGLTSDDMLGRTIADVLGPATLESLRPHIKRALAGEALTYEATIAYPHIGPRAMHVSYMPERGPDGAVAGYVVSATDITDRKAIEDALRESDLRFRSAFDDAPIGMCLVDAEGRFLQVNRALCELVGYDEAELLATDFPAITHPEDLPADLCRHRQMLSGRIRGYAIEKRYIHCDGYAVWVQLSASLIRDAEGRPRHIIAQIQDITQRRALEAEQERLLTEALERADGDPLTGLLNHRAFHKRLDEECRCAQPSGAPVAVVMLDLDNFKFFNDAYGHPAGDEVLRRVARTLTENARPGDTVARFGGDEFALLLPGLDHDAAAALVARIVAKLDEHGYRPEGGAVTVPLGVCAGVAVWPQEAATRRETVERADERLRRAKTGADDPQADALRLHMGRSLEGFSMLDALVTAVDNKDRYTRRHSEDVLSYSLEIAGQLGLDEKARENIAVAALLHDVGKIGVPDRILRKPGKLSDEEFAAVQQHPVMGAVIVAAVPGLEETLDAVRHHHERWDGKGYPFGLHGTECPLIARLMAVADAFSAMTTDRPYRKGMPHEKALGILEEGAGTQWDPECVAAFLRARRGELRLAA